MVPIYPVPISRSRTVEGGREGGRERERESARESARARERERKNARARERGQERERGRERTREREREIERDREREKERERDREREHERKRENLEKFMIRALPPSARTSYLEIDWGADGLVLRLGKETVYYRVVKGIILCPSNSVSVHLRLPTDSLPRLRKKTLHTREWGSHTLAWGVREEDGVGDQRGALRRQLCGGEG